MPPRSYKVALLFLMLGIASDSYHSASVMIDPDLAAIRELHQKDMEAAKAGDFETLRSLMTDDAVVIPPAGKVLQGKTAIDENFAAMKNATAGVEVLEYTLDFKEVKILGGYAYEWGEIRGTMRKRGNATAETLTFKVMRILQKQSNGAWKIHRTIWNNNDANLSR